MAEHVTSFFGLESYTIDNVLRPDDRDVFYILEEAGLVISDRYETLVDTKAWKTHGWLLNKITILSLAYGRKKVKADVIDPATCYDTVPDEVWAHLKAAN